jgi:DNA-binding NtrC family response regulator
MKYAQALRLWQREYFRALLEDNANDVRQVAKITGLNRTSLYRKLKVLDIQVSEWQQVVPGRTRRANTGNAAWQSLGK